MLLEIAVDDPLGLQAAVAGGANRIELCAALDSGGLTPSVGLMRIAAGCGLPVMAMIRPRPGGFQYDADELAVMATDIAAARQTGLAGVVFGALTPDHDLDLFAMRGLMARATGLQVTLHRAFDMVADWRRAVDQAVDLGITRILTSGAAVSALAGRDRLAEIAAYAGRRIAIMPGAGIRAANVGLLLDLPVSDIHASCGEEVVSDPASLAFGFASPTAKRTAAGQVRALKAALTAQASGASLP